MFSGVLKVAARSLFFSIFLSLGSFPSHILAQQLPNLPLLEKPPLAPLMYIFNSNENDFFFSTNISEIDFAKNVLGYDDLATPTQIGISSFLENSLQTNSQAIYEMTKTDATTHRFYTSSLTEYKTAILNGFIQKSIVGYVYKVQVPGTQILHRLKKSDTYRAKTVYALASHPNEISGFLQRGFIFDKEMGYSYSLTTPNLAPQVSEGRILGRRCQGSQSTCFADNYRDFYFNQGFGLSSIVKPGSRPKIHQLSFSLTTWDGFGPDKGHFDFMMRNRAYVDLNNILVSQFDGIGIIFGGFSCAGNTQGNRVTIELWRSDNGTNGQNFVDCEAMGPELKLGESYDVVARSFNNGDFFYQIKVRKNQQIIYQFQKNYKSIYENMGGQFKRFPTPELDGLEVTKHSVFHANDSLTDFTIYIENLNSIWLN